MRFYVCNMKCNFSGTDIYERMYNHFHFNSFQHSRKLLVMKKEKKNFFCLVNFAYFKYPIISFTFIALHWKVLWNCMLNRMKITRYLKISKFMLENFAYLQFCYVEDLLNRYQWFSIFLAPRDILLELKICNDSQ